MIVGRSLVSFDGFGTSVRRAALFAGLLLVACGSSDDDSGKKQPTPSGSVVYVADATPGGPSITLREKTLDDGKLVLEVVGHELDGVYGVALRVEVDADVLAYDQFTAAPLWPGQALTRGAEGKPGQLVLAVTHVGAQAGLSADDGVLATLSLTRKSSDPSAVTIVPSHSGLLGDDGKRKQVAFSGGALKRQ